MRNVQGIVLYEHKHIGRFSNLHQCTFNDLPDDVICNVVVYADDATLYFKCEQAADLWQQLELASELESDLRDTVD